MDLFLAVLGRRFTLIEPLQGPVVPLIELPGANTGIHSSSMVSMIIQRVLMARLSTEV